MLSLLMHQERIQKVWLGGANGDARDRGAVGTEVPEVVADVWVCVDSCFVDKSTVIDRRCISLSAVERC